MPDTGSAETLRSAYDQLTRDAVQHFFDPFAVFDTLGHFQRVVRHRGKKYNVEYKGNDDFKVLGKYLRVRGVVSVQPVENPEALEAEIYRAIAGRMIKNGC